MTSPLPALMLVTDRHATGGRDLLTVVQAALAAGLPAVQLRDKDLSGGALWRLAEQLRLATTASGAQFFVNDRVDIAVAVEADGVHLGEHSLPVAVARALLAPAQRIGVSTHSPGAPHAVGADYAFFGPVCATPSKAAFGPPQGWDALHAAVAATSVPVLAIGGLTPDDVVAVHRTGARGLAVIRAVLAADDPGVAVQSFLRALATN